jgi:hypothetical protein
MSPISPYIDALGGTRKAAAAFGVSLETVCNWRAAGLFPARRFPLVCATYERLGLCVPPLRLFSFKENVS